MSTEVSVPLEINGVFYQNVYYMPMIKGLGADRKGVYEIKDPPNTGWSRALVIWPDDEDDKFQSTLKRKKQTVKRVTVFCPYSLNAYQVRVTAREVSHQKAYPLTVNLINKLETIINKNWKMYLDFGYQRAYDVAALVLTKLGRPVPAHVPPKIKDFEYDHLNVPTRRGKPAADCLLQPVNGSSKMGQICAFFLRDGLNSIHEAMAKFDVTRSGILTHLYNIHKNHGIGYVLKGDTAVLLLPNNCSNPIMEKAELAQHNTVRKTGKPCKSSITRLPDKGKRRKVALLMVNEIPLAKVAEEVGCSLNSVKSHLHDLHTMHGFGYEFSSDKLSAKLIIPNNWTVVD